MQCKSCPIDIGVEKKKPCPVSYINPDNFSIFEKKVEYIKNMG